jgi:hypothetical protein
VDNCYGREVDHPSQTQYACLMGTISEHLDTYFKETFNQIRFELMVFRFWEQIVLMDIFTEFKQFKWNKWYTGGIFICLRLNQFEAKLNNCYP